MKKLLLYTLFAGLMISPFANLQGINNEDLQKMSANKLENKALENGQGIVAFLATAALIATGTFGIATINLAKDSKKDAAIFGGCVTTALGAATIGLWTGWYKLFKKRAERHGYKNNLFKFWFLDLLSNSQVQTQIHVQV